MSQFIAEFGQLLILPVVFGLVVIWFPWQRIVWTPRDSTKIEQDAIDALRHKNKKYAVSLFRQSYGLSARHAEFIVEGLATNLSSLSKELDREALVDVLLKN